MTNEDEQDFIEWRENTARVSEAIEAARSVIGDAQVEKAYSAFQKIRRPFDQY